MSEQRWAKVFGADWDVERVGAFLPRAWRTTGFGVTVAAEGFMVNRKYVRIAGYDVAGWTFEDYVVPRLASGAMYAQEEGKT